MNKLKTWLLQANGWQRLWLVASLLFIVFSSLVWPFASSGPMYYGNYQQLVQQEENPRCREYFVKPLGQLVKPGYQHECYDAYTSREIYGDSIVGEFTAKKYLGRLHEIHNKSLMEYALLGFVGSILLSLIFYGAGCVVAWVITGFKKQED